MGAKCTSVIVKQVWIRSMQDANSHRIYGSTNFISCSAPLKTIRLNASLV